MGEHTEEHESSDETMTPITNTERIELKRRGTSDGLRVPAEWKHTLPELKPPSPGMSIFFDATVMRDSNGRIFIVFAKVKTDIKEFVNGEKDKTET